ncbi:hypothetical protein ACFSSA_09935 [Luteolibacter algae]|uniref:Uncharacterized protein n=1 Tax=Luteolibacter algae TaxID=454151 RepID=A0ABW5D7Z2_9BACT
MTLVKQIPVLLLLLGTLSLSAQEDLDDQPAPRAVSVEDLLPKFDGDGTVISHTGQFKISGGNSADRGTAANLAEETKEEFLRLLEEKDEWKVPVVIKLIGEVGDPVPMRSTVQDIWYSGKGYEMRIMVNLSRGLQREPYKRSVMSSLIYARGVSDVESVNAEVPLSVPPWLVEGLLEANAWRLKQTDRKLYDALFQHGGLFKIDDLFGLGESEYSSIDAASRAAFRVSSGALVMALLEQPDGKTGIREFLKAVPSFQGEMPSLLRIHFPELNLSETSLAKWWALQLANKGTAPLTEAMTVAQTERALNEALRLRYRDDEGAMQEVPLTDWTHIAALEEGQRIDAVRLAQDDLLRLSYRCFPSYRMLLLEYQSLLTDFVKGETKSLTSSLNMLAETRQTMIAKADLARDFLDWFEITRARETSGVFNDYLNLKARLKSQPNFRRDRISEYLDRLDPLFHVPEKRRDPFSINDSMPPF